MQMQFKIDILIYSHPNTAGCILLYVSNTGISIFVQSAPWKIIKYLYNKISSNEKNLKQYVSGSYLEATIGFEPMIRVLQTRALPLGYVAVCCLHLQKLF